MQLERVASAVSVSRLTYTDMGGRSHCGSLGILGVSDDLLDKPIYNQSGVVASEKEYIRGRCMHISLIKRHFIIIKKSASDEFIPYRGQATSATSSLPWLDSQCCHMYLKHFQAPKCVAIMPVRIGSEPRKYTSSIISA